MVTSSPEKLQNKKSFTDLIHLREELTKEAKNKERLVEFEKTIDLALEQGKKKGVIEFTETEWKTLISNENLPPIEEVQALLQEKIDSAKEVASETKEKTGGLIQELKQKAEGLTGDAKTKIEQLKQKAEGLKKYSKPALWFLGLGLSLKIWGYKIANWFSGLFGKKGEYDDKIKLAEMEKEFMKDPEAAMKKYGTEALEKMKGTKPEAKEGSALEKVGPIAALGTAGVGIFSFAKKALPESMTQNLHPEDGKGILQMAVKSGRGLKLFGVAGGVLLGAGLLYAYLQTDTGKAALDRFPTDEEGKKTWWKETISKAGIGITEGASDIMAIVSGQKLDEYLTKRESERQEEGYCNLEDHPIVADASKKLRGWADILTAFAIENKEGLIAALIAGNFITDGAVIRNGVKGVELVWAILKSGAGTAFSHPLLLALGLGLGFNSVEGIKHIQVKKDMTSADIGEMMTDMLTLKELREFISSKFPESLDNKYIDSAIGEFNQLGATISNWKDNFEKNLDGVGLSFLEKLKITQKEKIQSINHKGLEGFRLRIRNMAEDKKGVMKVEYQELLGADGKGGKLNNCIEKTKNGQELTEGDIRSLMEATSKTDILIFPLGETREGDTIQWRMREGNGDLSLPRNLCINPMLSLENQYEEAKDFVVNPYEEGIINKGFLFGGKFIEGGQNFLSEIATAIRGGAGEIIQFGGKTLLYDYAIKKYITLPLDLMATALPQNWGGLTMQEFLVEQGQSMVPMMVIGFGTSLSSALFNRKIEGFSMGKVLLNTAKAPIKGTIGTFKIASMIYHRARSGDYKGIIRDPAIFIKEGFISTLERGAGGILESVNTPFMKDGVDMRERGEMREARQKLREYKFLSDRGVVHGSDKMYKLRTEINEIIKHLSPHTRESIFGHQDAYTTVVNETDMAKIYQDVEIYAQKLDKNIREALANHPSITHPEGEIPKTKAELEGMKGQFESKVTELENEKQKAIKDGTIGSKIKEFDTRTKQLKKAIKAIDGHIAIREVDVTHGTHGPETPHEKWGRRGRGLIGLALLAGAMIGIQKLRSDSPGMSIPELDALDEEREFYGFRHDGEIPQDEKEKKKTDNTVEKKEIQSIEKSPKYIQTFLKRMSEIQGMYGTEFDFICDPKKLKNADDKVIESKINGLTNIHKEMLKEAKKSIKENKEEIKKFFKESKEKNIYVRKNNLNAFMGLAEKDNGDIEFEYMNEESFSDTIWELADFQKDNADNLIAGTYNNWDKAGYMALRALPATSEYYDGRDMIRNFSRGKIGNGFKSMGWLALGAVCDVGMFFTFGGTEAAKVAVVGTRTGLGWAKMSKIFNVIKGMRIPLNIAKDSGIFTKALAFSMTHSGKMMFAGIGADTAHQMIEFPRSESIKIDSL